VVAEIVPAVPVTDEEFETGNGALGSGLDSIVVPTVVVVNLNPLPVGPVVLVELEIGKGAEVSDVGDAKGPVPKLGLVGANPLLGRGVVKPVPPNIVEAAVPVPIENKVVEFSSGKGAKLSEAD